MEREKERDRQERGDKMAAVSEVRVDQEDPIWTSKRGHAGVVLLQEAAAP